MDSLFSVFLLFIAAITSLITYMVVPYLPVVTLTMAAAVALAAGVWWHWTQFSVDYRTSTWQEQLQYYASYAMVLVVILLSYAFYVFAYSGSSLQEYAARGVAASRNVGRRTVSTVIGTTTRALSSTQNALLGEATVAPNRAPSEGRGGTNFLA
jgi:hypothetical protein